MTQLDPIALMAGLVLDNGKRWGDIAAPFQLEDARAILTPDPDGARLHWLGRPKGGSKTTDIAGMVAAWLTCQASDLAEGFVLAADKEQAERLVRFAAGLIARTPGLGDVLEVQRQRIVHRATGASVTALAADAAGGNEGILSPLVLVDELPQWADTKGARLLWDAAFSSIPKAPGCRFVVIGHAGVSGSWQHKIFETLSASPLWRVNDVPGPLPWIDAAVLADQQALLTATQFARRHLNQWSSSDEALVTLEDLRRCVTLDGPLLPRSGMRYMIGLDLGLVSDRTVAAVCHAERIDGGTPSRWVEREPTERERYDAMRRGAPAPSAVRVLADPEPVRIVLDRMEVWQGSKANKVAIGEVEAWVLQASRSFNGAGLVCDPWQAVGMAQRLRGSGVTVNEFDFGQASVGRLASTLYRLLRDGNLALPDDEELIDELLNVKLIEKSSGVVRMDHASGRHDDRALALALAAHKLLNEPPPAPTEVVAYENRALSGSR